MYLRACQSQNGKSPATLTLFRRERGLHAGQERLLEKGGASAAPGGAAAGSAGADISRFTKDVERGEPRYLISLEL